MPKKKPKKGKPEVHKDLSGFDPLIFGKIQHKGILTFFEKFNFNKKNYVVAQNTANDTLATCDSELHFTQIVNWILCLAETVDFLHRHGPGDLFAVTDLLCLHGYNSTLRHHGPALDNGHHCRGNGSFLYVDYGDRYGGFYFYF